MISDQSLLLSTIVLNDIVTGIIMTVNIITVVFGNFVCQ